MTLNWYSESPEATLLTINLTQLRGVSIVKL